MPILSVNIVAANDLKITKSKIHKSCNICNISQTLFHAALSYEQKLTSSYAEVMLIIHVANSSFLH